MIKIIHIVSSICLIFIQMTGVTEYKQFEYNTMRIVYTNGRLVFHNYTTNTKRMFGKMYSIALYKNYSTTIYKHLDITNIQSLDIHWLESLMNRDKVCHFSSLYKQLFESSIWFGSFITWCRKMLCHFLNGKTLSLIRLRLCGLVIS